jgi:hypothetical protein
MKKFLFSVGMFAINALGLEQAKDNVIIIWK